MQTREFFSLPKKLWLDARVGGVVVVVVWYWCGNKTKKKSVGVRILVVLLVWDEIILVG
jgi:hypothetical protein